MDTQQARQSSATQPVVSAPDLPEPTVSNWRTKAALIGGGLLLLAIILGVIFLLTRNPQLTANLRDIAIIAFATIGLIMSVIIGALLIVMIYYMQSLVALLRNEIKPMLANVQQTVQTVRGTTTLVSDNVAKPVIKFASFLAGLEAARTTLTGKMGRDKKSSGTP